MLQAELVASTNVNVTHRLRRSRVTWRGSANPWLSSFVDFGSAVIDCWFGTLTPVLRRYRVRFQPSATSARGQLSRDIKNIVQNKRFDIRYRSARSLSTGQDRS